MTTMAQGVTNQAMAAKRMLIETMPCPQCGAAAGVRCKTPSGSVLLVPHQARRSAAADAKVYVP
jgi:hypothetical protein